jgi:UDP-N-acetylmuramate dehydrogenase
MIKIQENINLAPYTTFRIGKTAEFFVVVKDLKELKEALSFAKENKKPIFILGGGSNILISKKIKGLVIKNEIHGMEVIERNTDYALVEAKGGEPWTKFVNFVIGHGLYGLENLFLIYGTVGAAPVQNIGAYGVELKDVFHHLKAIDLKTGHEKIFSAADCFFGYRDSIFKNKLKGKYFIYSVTVKLKRQPNFKLDYSSLGAELAKKGIEEPRLRDVINIITEIRNNKLPNPGILPNAGSYFKNVEVSERKFKSLLKKYPDIPSFPAGNKNIKIPSGWLIDKAGFKGKKFGPVSMYEKQALILVNHGGAEAKHVLLLAEKVKMAVKKTFGVDLEEEVRVI